MEMNRTSLILSLTAFAIADFQIHCWQPVARGYQDPIVSPGQRSQHAHEIFGTATDLSQVNGTAALTAAQCSACNFEADRSLYWFPSLYMIDGGNRVRVDARMGVYYRTKWTKASPPPEMVFVWSSNRRRMSRALFPDTFAKMVPKVSRSNLGQQALVPAS